MAIQGELGGVARPKAVPEFVSADAAPITGLAPASGPVRPWAEFPRVLLLLLAGGLLSLIMLAGQGHYLPQTNPIRLTSQASKMSASAAEHRGGGKDATASQIQKRRWVPAGIGIARRIPSVLDAMLPSLTSAWAAIQLRSPPPSAV